MFYSNLLITIENLIRFANEFVQMHVHMPKRGREDGLAEGCVVLCSIGT